MGLRVGHEASLELGREETLAEFAACLGDAGLYVFTVNGFPYGRFHRTRVKEQVYQPDWRTEERRDYTIRLADIMARLLPADARGSISTVPGSFKPWIDGPQDVEAMVRKLMDAVAHLAELQGNTGKEIHLGLEPEPGCFVETTDETIRFFNDVVLHYGTDVLRARTGCGHGAAEEQIRRHLGICFDTCHLAIQYEDLVESLDRYEREGIRLSKIQISAALSAGNDEAGRAALLPFDEPVYLHQVVARGGDPGTRAWTDLPAALEDLEGSPEYRDLRVHFHVPLFWEGSEVLGSTSADLTPDFFERLRQGVCEHLEIETYTFDVLPEDVRTTDVVESIAREYSWVTQNLDRKC